jgi:hypothetical protein
MINDSFQSDDDSMDSKDYGNSSTIPENGIPGELKNLFSKL